MLKLSRVNTTILQAVWLVPVVRLNRAIASTGDMLGGPFGGTTRCSSVTLKGDTMHVLVKSVDGANSTRSDMFEGCPEAPVAAEFLDDDGFFDLAAVGADLAITLRRTPEVRRNATTWSSI